MKAAQTNDILLSRKEEDIVDRLATTLKTLDILNKYTEIRIYGRTAYARTRYGANSTNK